MVMDMCSKILRPLTLEPSTLDLVLSESHFEYFDPSMSSTLSRTPLLASHQEFVPASHQERVLIL